MLYPLYNFCMMFHVKICHDGQKKSWWQVIEFCTMFRDDVIKWKHYPRYWPFVRGIHRWIPFTKASDAELRCFLWSVPEQTVVSKQSKRRWFETPSRSLWRHCNVPETIHCFEMIVITFIRNQTTKKEFGESYNPCLFSWPQWTRVAFHKR